MQVPTLEQFEKLRQVVLGLVSELKQVQASLPQWVQEEEAQRLTGLKRTQLYRERKKSIAGLSLIQWKEDPGLRYLRASLLAYNEAQTIRRR